MTRHLLVAAATALCLAACAPSADRKPVDELVTEARALDQDGRHAEAAALFREALDEAPDSYDAHYGLARALDLDGAYEEARQHFARAIELAPDGSLDQAQRMQGIAWTFVGNVGEASRLFRQVYERRLEAGVFSSAAEEANELGRVYLELGNPDEAESWYRTGFEVAGREDGRPEWQVNLAALRWEHAEARIAARRARHDDAARHAAEVRRLLDLGGNDDQEPQYAYLLGYLAMEAGDAGAALTQLARADQDDPFIPLLEARAAERAGDPARARGFYEQVMASSSHGIGAAFARPEARAWLEGRR